MLGRLLAMAAMVVVGATVTILLVTAEARLRSGKQNKDPLLLTTFPSQNKLYETPSVQHVSWESPEDVASTPVNSRRKRLARTEDEGSPATTQPDDAIDGLLTALRRKLLAMETTNLPSYFTSMNDTHRRIRHRKHKLHHRAGKEDALFIPRAFLNRHERINELLEKDISNEVAVETPASHDGSLIYRDDFASEVEEVILLAVPLSLLLTLVLLVCAAACCYRHRQHLQQEKYLQQFQEVDFVEDSPSCGTSVCEAFCLPDMSYQRHRAEWIAKNSPRRYFRGFHSEDDFEDGYDPEIAEDHAQLKGHPPLHALLSNLSPVRRGIRHERDDLSPLVKSPGLRRSLSLECL